MGIACTNGAIILDNLSQYLAQSGMPLTVENYEIWYKLFRSAIHRISGGTFSQFDSFLGWDKESITENYLGLDYLEAARDELELQLSCAL